MEELFNQLREMASLESNQWKSRAYKNAISILSQIPESEFNSRKKFRDIPGIGSGLEKKILEYKKSGAISKLAELRLANPRKLDKELYKVRDSYVTKRIPLSDAEHLYSGLAKVIDVDPSDITLCGSARRKKSLVGDLDIVIRSEDKDLLSSIKYKLSDYKVTVSGKKKMSFIIQESTMTPVDIYLTDPATYIPMVLYLTGSKEFNIMMRGKAKKLGYKLNQYGLWDKEGKEVTVTSEEDLFDLLGMKYVNPENR